MQFTRLRLSGFKSFADTAEIEIRTGLTGIVGPNGCGKSNLLEALRWVMGEGSARALRTAGAGMDDVIFAGTMRRPRRDIAEVQLLLDNSARRAPAEFNDSDQLEIGRQVLRGAGSIYRLNGREVRQKDVRLLFADAATGANSPALVSQGKVAAIIAARPQERRQLLEDAAGIAGLNARRHEAEQRLRAADANLARVGDLLQNLQRQAAALERQVRTAVRYRELSEQIRTREEALLRLEWAETVDAVQTAGQRLAEAEAGLQQGMEAAAEAAHAQAEAAAALPDKRRAQAAVAAKLQALAAEHATAVAQQAGLVQRLQDLQAALTHARQDVERETLRQRDSAAMQARLQADLALQEQAALEIAATRAPQQARVQQTEAAATDSGRQLAQAVDAHAALVAEARGGRAQAEAARSRHARLAQERQRLTKELTQLQGRAAQSSLPEQIASAEAGQAALAAELDAARAAIDAAERDAERARRQLAAIEPARTALQRQIAGLEAEAEALQRLRQRQCKAGGEGSAMLRTAIVVAPGYEAALAAALGDDVHAVLARGQPGEDAPAARHWLALHVPADDPLLPGFCQPLAPHVRAPAELARCLAQTGIVEAAPAPAQLQQLRPGQQLVSRAGWLWRWDGLVAPPGTRAGGVAEALVQDNRLQEIADSLPAPRQQLVQAEAELQQQQALLRAADSAGREARSLRAGKERQREQLHGWLQGLQAAAAQAAARQGAIENSLQRLDAEAETAALEVARADAAVAELPDASAAAQVVGEARTRDERARAALADARAQAAAVERALAEANARPARLKQEIAGWQARQREASAAVTALQQRAGDLASEQAQLVAEPDALQARIVLLQQDIATTEQARQTADDAVAAAELTLADLDRATRAADAEVAQGRENRATLAAEVAQLRNRLATLVQQSRERFSCQPAELAMPEGGRSAELQAALTQLLAARERIGAVNLRAEIELQELQADIAAQENARNDLEIAMRRLRASIGTLNREGRARLLSAFQQVERHFRQLFETLFGGGIAELELVEDEDPLLSGLEIRAQPPGKKLQSLSLLSGGEQALTAIALIFALFHTNMAPICVLDEVDAPLDDANVERLTRLLAHMAESTDTRFLIVTHNPLTMAAMHRLYGVTMAEAGVSQLVSVALPAVP